jgi:hypothetical protein
MKLIFKISIGLFFTFSINIFNIKAQHLVGVKRNSLAQNYKLTSNSNQRFEGYTQKQIAKEETQNKKDQEIATKELLESHIKKQSKATQKRMRANLKLATKRTKKKQTTFRWVVNYKRRKILSQRKENKYDE